MPSESNKDLLCWTVMMPIAVLMRRNTSNRKVILLEDRKKGGFESNVLLCGRGFYWCQRWKWNPFQEK